MAPILLLRTLHFSLGLASGERQSVGCVRRHGIPPLSWRAEDNGMEGMAQGFSRLSVRILRELCKLEIHIPILDRKLGLKEAV